MESTWESRDLPVLDYIVRFYDEHGEPPEVSELGEACGLDDEDVQRALRALEHNEPAFNTDFFATFGGIMAIGAPTGHARRTVGAWPTPESLADRIVAGLNDAAEQESDPEAKGRLKRAAQAVSDVGRDVVVRVLSEVVVRQVQ